MIRFQVADSYSKALFKSPCSKEELEKRASILEDMNKRIHANPKFHQYLYAPDLSIAEREGLLRKVLDSDLDPKLADFFFLLLKRNRIEYLGDIAKAYRHLVNKSLRILDVNL